MMFVSPSLSTKVHDLMCWFHRCWVSCTFSNPLKNCIGMMPNTFYSKSKHSGAASSGGSLLRSTKFLSLFSVITGAVVLVSKCCFIKAISSSLSFSLFVSFLGGSSLDCSYCWVTKLAGIDWETAVLALWMLLLATFELTIGVVYFSMTFLNRLGWGGLLEFYRCAWRMMYAW